jgi:hypothetical protein
MILPDHWELVKMNYQARKIVEEIVAKCNLIFPQHVRTAKKICLRVDSYLLPASAFLSGHSSPTASPHRYRPNNSLDRWARMRRTSRRLPLILAIFIES